MSRAVRWISTTGLAVATVLTMSSTASALKPFHSPAEREEARARALESPAASTACGPFPGGSTTQVNCTMSYGNGQLIANVNVVPVFWTYGGKTVDSTITAWAPPYLSALVESPFLDLLSEYSAGGQSITRGTSTQPYTITPTTVTSASINDSQITKELAAQVAAGSLPKGTTDATGRANTLYVLFFPTGVTITLGSGNNAQVSCASGGFCGYHSSGSSGGTTFLYAVIPDLSQVQTYTHSDGGTVTEPCGYGCAYEASTKPEVEWFNGTISHEVAEAVTDPVGSRGWYDQKNNNVACGGSASQGIPGGGEIGDVCVGFWDTGECEDTPLIPGMNIAAQQMWSNALQGCYVANPATPVKCPPTGCVDGGAGPASPVLDGGAAPQDASTGGGSDASTGGGGDASSATDATAPGQDGSTPVMGDEGGTPISGKDSGSGVASADAASTTRAGDGGADGDQSPGGASNGSGCSCTTAATSDSSPFAASGALLAMAALAGRRSRRRA